MTSTLQNKARKVHKTGEKPRFKPTTFFKTNPTTAGLSISYILQSIDVAAAHASARFKLAIASSISCVFLKPTVAQSTPAFWKANRMAFTRSS
jgi:hypothetical protein